ncbi:MAG TPA: hypothetical protein VGK40_11005 [Verrucomicrobiae bacterium]|jgi:hypothetical protein
MNPPQQGLRSFRGPKLTRLRIGLAFLVALIADGLQLLLGPLGWALFDEIIDLLAMILVTVLLGFHILFLPTFVAEIIPVIDMLPTWTGCVALVVTLRRKQQAANKTRTET